ncbi:MAG: aminotransferase class III-fold pyridoxal phosphate-dependent enzyme [Oligoflexus sp.]
MRQLRLAHFTFQARFFTFSEACLQLAGDLAAMSCSFIYKKPASPNQAATAEGQPAPDLGSLSKAFSQYFDQNSPKPLLIEGAGGLLVPLNQHFETWLDWLQEVRVPTLVVARSELGTLNHTALTLRQLTQEAIPILGVVLNGLIHPENLQSLREWFPDIAFHQFPYLENIHNQDPYWRQQSQLLAEWVQHQRANYQTLKKSPKWLQADQKHCWHPYTQHKTSPKALPIIRAKGVWLEAADGQQYLDGISSWWTNTIGHGHPAIGHAIAKQQATLDHVLFAGVTHQAASLLSEKLSALTDHRLPRVFYSDNGSCAVEVALKIALQRWTNQDINHRRKILSFQGSYHGDTFGTMAVAAADSFHGAFRDMMFQPLLATPI